MCYYHFIVSLHCCYISCYHFIVATLMEIVCWYQFIVAISMENGDYVLPSLYCCHLNGDFVLPSLYCYHLNGDFVLVSLYCCHLNADCVLVSASAEQLRTRSQQSQSLSLWEGGRRWSARMILRWKWKCQKKKVKVTTEKYDSNSKVARLVEWSRLFVTIAEQLRNKNRRTCFLAKVLNKEKSIWWKY